ncbi:MAG: hypothetical protein ACREAC_04600, partial [Blastocatellia bacterium]
MVVIGLVFVGAGSSAPVTSPSFFLPHLTAGDRVSQIFSRSLSVKVDGFPEKVSRTSGSATYVVKTVDSSRISLDVLYRYDGRVAGRSPIQYDLKTLDTIGDDGKAVPATDASGLLFNPLLWGTPATTLKPGLSWTVDIGRKWELGPAGSQTVKVISADPANHTVTLMREGHGSGLFDGEKDTFQLPVDGREQTASITPGESHWFGYTTFRDGIVMSDALLVERAQTIVAGSRKCSSVE